MGGHRPRRSYVTDVATDVERTFGGELDMETWWAAVETNLREGTWRRRASAAWQDRSSSLSRAIVGGREPYIFAR